MPSAFTWLDYSERDRRRALDVVDLFRENSTVDELGVGSIRDSFSDLFFPGTSTIQTRGCYFLLLPWTFLRMERMRVPSSSAEAWARKAELDLNERLLRGEDTSGVFGSQRGRALKRLPSLAYWGGLRSWGILLFEGIASAYFRSLDGHYRRVDTAVGMPRDPEGRAPMAANWHPHIPDPPKGFPRNVNVALRREDSVYLGDRIQSLHSGSLLATLARSSDFEVLQAEWPWELAERVKISTPLKRQLQDARILSIGLHGAALLYNLMLAEQSNQRNLIDDYRGDIEHWAIEVESIRATWKDWSLEGVWAVVQSQGRSIGHPTRAFVERWFRGLMAREARSVLDTDSPARSLVRDRELQLKGGRARLHSVRHRELWGGSSGTGRLGFRWSDARVLLEDIFDGLEEGGDHAGHA